MIKKELNKLDLNLFEENLKNGLKIYMIPNNKVNNIYVTYTAFYGSCDNEFIPFGKNEYEKVPDGVAHFLEHKLFEQENGEDPFSFFSKNGADVNAYTSFFGTTYLFSGMEHFNENLKYLLNYVESPYFTDENVEKEKGIIGQEIMMYDDDPGFKLYLNTMDCLYHKNAVKLDIAGTIESISKINPDVLYKCYNTFYHPSNMTLVVCGNFKPEELLEEIKKRLKKTEKQEEIKRIYEVEDETINQKVKEVNMEVSVPIFMIGIKDNKLNDDEIVKKHLAIEIILNMLIGKSSDLYKDLYNKGYLLGEPDLDYEFSKQYAHVLISGQSKNYNEIMEAVKEKIENYKKNGLNDEDFERIKRKIYGDYVSEYNNVGNIARFFLSDSFKGINCFDYIDKYDTVTKEYTEQVLKQVFNEDKMVLSVIKPK